MKQQLGIKIGVWVLKSNFQSTGLVEQLAFKGQFKFNISVCVTYSTSNQVTMEHSQEFTQDIVVAPGNMVRVLLKVNKQENVQLPFVATISCRYHDGNCQIIKEKGTWMGCVYETFEVEISEEPLKLADLQMTL